VILAHECFYGQIPKDLIALFEKKWFEIQPKSKKETDICSAKTKDWLSEKVNNFQGSFFVELDGQWNKNHYNDLNTFKRSLKNVRFQSNNLELEFIVV
jgi:hypothetical protein